MEYAGLLCAMLLPWALGVAAMLALRDAYSPIDSPGEIAWSAGVGYLVGAMLLTWWMRILSLADIRFGAAAIALPLAFVGVALGAYAWRRHPRLGSSISNALHTLIKPPGLSGALRFLWLGLLVWLVVRFGLLAYEVALRPLYPWDAWIKWATKAHVYFEFGRIAPFVAADVWLAGSEAWFDASPESPVTLPLLQTWICIMLGRWDDVLMNWPWWQLAVALGLLVYGGLRKQGLDRVGALVGAYFAVSLPLVDVHVALAGYADLPLAIFYVATVFAFMQWSATRTFRDLAVLILLIIACPLIKKAGEVWVLTLVPGLLLVLLPRKGPKILGGAFGLALFILAVLAQTHPVVGGRDWHIDFAPPWATLPEIYFLLANWHLLWYGLIGVAILAWRQLLSPSLAPLTAIVATGLFFVATLFVFPNLRFALADPPTQERLTLHFAPLIVVYIVLAFHAFATAWTSRRSKPSASSPQEPSAQEPIAALQSVDAPPAMPPAGEATSAPHA